MDKEQQDLTQQVAEAIGDSVEKTSAFVIDQVEDLSLWLMEKAAESNPNSENLAQVGQVLHSLRKVMAHLPQAAGSLAEGSTFIGLNLGREAWRAVKNHLDEQGQDREA